MKIMKFKKSTKGFSLIELMVVIVIISILAAVAIPSYKDYMIDSRRVDAVSFLTEVASEQIRFSSENNRYTSKMSELGFGEADTAVSSDGFYTVSITLTKEGQSYELIATPVTGGPQAKDVDCGSLKINSSKQKSVTGNANVADCW